MESLEGTLERITYYNEDTLFMVARLRSDDEQLHAIIGNLPRLVWGRLVLQGEWTVHRDYGRQFKVYRYETKLP